MLPWRCNFTVNQNEGVHKITGNETDLKETEIGDEYNRTGEAGQSINTKSRSEQVEFEK